MMTTRDQMGDIDCIYNEMDAIIESILDSLNAASANPEDKRHRDKSYGLVMALKRINDEIGRRAGVI